LIQENFFSASHFGEIAKQLDEAEQDRMAEGGTDRAEYQNFIKVTINII